MRDIHKKAPKIEIISQLACVVVVLVVDVELEEVGSKLVLPAVMVSVMVM